MLCSTPKILLQILQLFISNQLFFFQWWQQIFRLCTHFSLLHTCSLNAFTFFKPNSFFVHISHRMICMIKTNCSDNFWWWQVTSNSGELNQLALLRRLSLEVRFWKPFGNCGNTDGTAFLWSLQFVFPSIKQDLSKCSLHKQPLWRPILSSNSSKPLLCKFWTFLWKSMKRNTKTFLNFICTTKSSTRTNYVKQYPNEKTSSKIPCMLMTTCV